MGFGSEPLVIFIVEDEEAHYQLMKRSIERVFPLASVHYFDEVPACLQALQEIRPDVIVADYLMPGMTGIDFLETLEGVIKDTPVIIITGQGDEKIAVQAMKLGAWDYLIKSADFFALLPSTIEKVVRERKLRESLSESARLNKILIDSLPHPAMLISRDRTIIAVNRVAQDVGASVGGCCWREFGHGDFISEEHKQYMREHAGKIPPGGTGCTFCLADQALAENRPINAPEVQVFNRWWDIWWIPVDEERFLQYTIDVTERRRAEEALRASHRFLKMANQHVEMKPLLKGSVAEIKKFSGCGAVGIRILDGRGNIPYAAYEGFSQRFYELESPLSIRSDECMCINVIKGTIDSSLPFHTRGGSFHMNHTTRFLASLPEEEKGRTRNTCNEFGYESVALIPIPMRDRILGLIHVADTRPDMLPRETVITLEGVAIELGTAIQRVLAEESLRESEKQLRSLSSRLLSAQEDERKRIARELHDSIGSSLSAIKIGLENTRHQLMQGTATHESLEVPIAWTQHTMDEARRLMMDLRPSLLDDLGIVKTLKWFCREFRSTYWNIRLEERIEMEEDEVPEQTKIVIFRVMQEALHNVAKHSGADLVSLSLVRRDHATELTIKDNGVGFDLSAARSRNRQKGGLGLTSMRERVELSGGSFTIESIPHQGSRIRAVWLREAFRL